eukprot:TRINITY_DN8606_c1_g1_i1.p1 TRINITY_DN8606_c1_g1~~TRINITY_DN8606_c1_g1_i1.p1  ORF type:complete len:407 (+),score=71.79 TRINITY_DN8606_c1_g1_i1:83-1303(+)
MGQQVCSCCFGKLDEWQEPPPSLALPPKIAAEVCGPVPAPLIVSNDNWRTFFPQTRRRNTSVASSRSMTRRKTEEDENVQQCDITDASSDSGSGDEEEDTDVTCSPSQKCRGSDMFEKRRSSLALEQFTTSDQIVDVPLLSASVKQLAEGKWRIHGLRVEKMLKRGIRRLDRRVDPDAINDLPRNASGKSLLLRHSLIKDMLTGTRTLSSVPPSDAAAAQKDLARLSLQQLVRLRVLNLDFASGGNGVHGAFLSMVDDLIFQNIGQKAADTTSASDISVARRLGEDIVMLIAAAKSLSTPQCWVCWFKDRRVFMHAGRLACTDSVGAAFGEGAVLECVDKSEPDKDTAGKQYWLELIVTLVGDKASLSSKASADGNKASRSMVFRQLTASSLEDMRSALKPVQRHE